MKSGFTLASVAMLLAAAAVGQGGCPHKEAEHVPETFTFHGAQACAGATINIGGATIQTPGQACPVMGVYTPPNEHEVSAGKDKATRVQVVGQAPTRVYHFRCQTDWYLIVPWGSSCRVSTQLNGASVLRMITVPC